MMDEGGYVALLSEGDLKRVVESELVGEIKLGVDPSEEGNDKTIWVLKLLQLPKIV